MPKKESTRSRVEDFLVLLLCLVGIAVSLHAFITELNAALVKLNETPVATITFKYRTAQRRTVDRVLWDRLRQESPIYNGDTIRTAERSEATLHFDDGSSVDLTENTMIQVFVLEGGDAQVSLEDGTVLVSNTAGSRSMNLSSGGNTLSLAPGSSVAARGGEASLSLRVLDGTVADSAGTQLESGMNAQVSGSEITASTRALVTSPALNSRFLQHERGPYPVPFRFSPDAGIGEAGPVTLVFSSSRTFESDALSVAVSSSAGIEVPLEPGPWYWQLRNETGTLEEGQFQVCDALDPMVIAPAENYEYRFRSRYPAIRFIWTENDYTSFWRLNVADNPGMNNPVVEQRCSRPSSIVSSLGEGVWYWQVTPWYPVNNTGYVGPTPVSRFTVLRKEALSVPELLVPRRDEIVSTGGNNHTILFSWKSSADAESAIITIADNESLLSPIVSETVRGNVFNLSTAATLLREGRWYWSVRHVDQEGTESYPASVRQFVAMEEATEQRLLYPPDGYTIAQGLVADTPFTWKTNSAEDTRLQIASSSDFSSPVINQVHNGGSASCPYLDTGIWYWRIVTRAAGLEIAASPRRFTVAGPLTTPVPVSPEPESRVVARPGGSVTFSWKPVTGATSYTFRLYRSDNENKSLLERAWISGTETVIQRDSIPEGDWLWTVQAFAEETAHATRRNGAVGRYTFTMRHLNPVVLFSPRDGARIDGLEARLNPISVRWRAPEETERTRLIIARDRKSLAGLARNPDAVPPGDPVIIVNPGRTVPLPPLEEGTWWWTVAGTSRDGLNMTPSSPRSIQVLMIPRLSAPVLREPPADTRYGPEFIEAREPLEFSWDAVEGATHYRLEIKNDAGTIVHLATAHESSAYVITDITELDTGNFRWTVEALRLQKDGTVVQKGTPAESDFTLYLPEMVIPRSRTRRTLYGN